MKKIFFWVFLFVLPFVLAVEQCKNGVKDGKEQGVDCGFFACGRPCVVNEGSELTLPGQAPKVPSVPVQPVPSPIQASSQTPVQSSLPPAQLQKTVPQVSQSPQQSQELPPGPADIEGIPEMLPPIQEKVVSSLSQISDNKLQAPKEELPEPVKLAQELPTTTQIDWGKIGQNVMSYLVTAFRYFLYLSLLFVILWGGYRSYKASQPHTDQDLVKYIKSCLERKITKEKIHEKLREAGHTQKTIEHHFRQFQK